MNVYVFPVLTFANEKKPKELVVAVCKTTPWESVIDTVAFRRPRPSDVSTFPSTVASVGVGLGVGVGVGVSVGVGVGVGVGVDETTRLTLSEIIPVAGGFEPL